MSQEGPGLFFSLLLPIEKYPNLVLLWPENGDRTKYKVWTMSSPVVVLSSPVVVLSGPVVVLSSNPQNPSRSDASMACALGPGPWGPWAPWAPWGPWGLGPLAGSAGPGPAWGP